jgi:hypothetical protein
LGYASHSHYLTLGHSLLLALRYQLDSVLSVILKDLIHILDYFLGLVVIVATLADYILAALGVLSEISAYTITLFGDTELSYKFSVVGVRLARVILGVTELSGDRLFFELNLWLYLQIEVFKAFLFGQDLLGVILAISGFSWCWLLDFVITRV